MCDCYWPKCEICDETIPVHIGDFRYPREDVKVWCGKHIPRDEYDDPSPGVEVFVLWHDPDDDLPIGSSFGLMLLGGTARPSDHDVSVNLSGADPIKEFRHHQ
jgi:hypothetical protein